MTGRRGDTMKTIKDGWHIIAGYDVYVEGGKILRGVLGFVCARPYRKEYGTQYDDSMRKVRVWTGGWNECAGISVSAFRAGVKRGTITLQ